MMSSSPGSRDDVGLRPIVFGLLLLLLLSALLDRRNGMLDDAVVESRQAQSSIPTLTVEEQVREMLTHD